MAAAKFITQVLGGDNRRLPFGVKEKWPWPLELD